MSLKIMHTVFVILSCVFAILFAAWSWREWTRGGGSVWAMVSIGSAAGSVALMAYGARFVRKTWGIV